MAFQDKIAKAKEAGYSDAEIQQYIKTKVDKAKAAGYSEQEISAYLGSQSETKQPSQKTVMQHLSQLPQSPVGIPGTVPMGMTGGKPAGIQQSFDAAGQGIAEAAGEAGYPIPGAVAGTAMAMAPDIISSVPGGMGGAKVASKAGKGLKMGGKKFWESIETVFKPGAEKMRIGKAQKSGEILEKIKQLDIYKDRLGENIKKIGYRISAVEKKAGKELKDTGKIANELLDKKHVNRKIDILHDSAKKGPEWLKQNITPEVIQDSKKFLEAAASSASLTPAQLAAVKIASSTFGKAIPETAVLRGRMGKLYKALEKAPKSARLKQELGSVRRQYDKLIIEGRKADLYRQRLGNLIKVGTGIGVGGAILSKLGGN